MELREYQKEIARKIDELYNGIGREERNFVGVKLPTGGGKSFIFMDQLIKFSQKYNEENPPKNCISEVPIKYYAPLNGINLQTQINVAKYIILEEYIKMFKSNNKISEIKNEDIKKAFDILSERMLDKAGKKGKKREQLKERINRAYSRRIKEGKKPEETLRRILTDTLFLINDVEKIVKGEFPNLEFACYQKKEKINPNADTRLVVFDEAHRTGAKEWGKNAKEMMQKLIKAKFLAITATPERDVDGKDPMEEFAILSEYSVSELRKRKYLAADMNLVTTLNQYLVVKPEVVTFDCMLDETIEYDKVKKLLDNLKEKVENDRKKHEERQRKAIKQNKKIPDQTAKEKENYSKYLEVLLNFCNMCKLSGKLDFIKLHLSSDNPKDMELLKFIDKPEFDKNQINLEYLKEKIDEIDDENSEIHKEYKKWKMQKVKIIIEEVLKSRGYLNHGKYVCFTPLSDDTSKTKSIMEEHKKLMEYLLGLSDDDVLITHSNTEVISKKQDEENLKEFMIEREPDSPIQVMVAMKKFDEGLHVDGVVAEFMCRQIDETTNKRGKNGDEDPKTSFLQQLGRCIYSIDPNEEITELPFVFDLACNFMRYNERLNNMFIISDNQKKFRELYHKCIPKKIKPDIETVIDILQVLSENEIDISTIDSKTTWEEFEKNIPQEKLNEILDEIYFLTEMRIKPDYKIGNKLVSARNAFWHIETKNKTSGGIKKYYNASTDKIFKTQTFEKLQRIGFFKDMEKSPDFSKIDRYGFVIGDCANLDEGGFGLNIYTGSRYTAPNEQIGIPGFDINGFSKKGIHVKTAIRYNENFFSYNPKTGEWTNLFTGKDEDLLGFDHSGVRVNFDTDLEFDQYGFNRDGIHRDTHCRYNKEGLSRREIGISKRPEQAFPIRDILMGKYLLNVHEPERSDEIEKKLIEWTVLYRNYGAIKRSNWYKAVIEENYEKKFGKKLSKEVLDRCKECQKSMKLLNEELLEMSQDLDEEIRENSAEISRKEDEKQSALKAKSTSKSQSQSYPQSSSTSGKIDHEVADD